jgi:hypothetical protein
VRKVLTIVAMLAAGAALPSCTTDRAETASAPAYERSAHIDRAPLPPQGYAPDTTPVVPSGSYTDFSNENGTLETGGRLTWRASPRWSAVKGNDCVSVEQNARGEFDVANCSPEGAAHRTY